MAKHRGVARDEFGNSLSGASVTVYDPDGSTESTLYSDSELATSLENPITTGANGVYEFYVVPGYYDIQVAAAGFTTVTLTNEQIGKVMVFIDMSAAGHNVVDIGPTANNCIGNNNWTAVIDSADLPNVFKMNEDTGLITYTGEPSIRCLFTWTQQLYTFAGSAPTQVYMRCAVNWGGVDGVVPVDGYICMNFCDVRTDVTDQYTFASSGVFTLQTGDTLHLMIQDPAGVADVYVGQGGFAITSFD